MPPAPRLPRALTATLAVALVSAAAAAPAAAAPSARPYAADVRVLRATTPDGSAVAAEVPAGWNGVLVVWNHGYRQAGDPRHGIPADPNTADVAKSPEVVQRLLAQGYALAGSSYSATGFATREAVRADVELYRWFARSVGAPRRVLVTGESLGGLITELVAERYPGMVSGALEVGAVVGGTVRNFDLGLDYEALVKALIDPALPVVRFRSTQQALDAFQHTYRTILAALGSSDSLTRARMAGRLLAVQTLLDGPEKSRTSDGTGLAGAVRAAVETIASGLFYSTVDRAELERRVAGNPSTNLGVDYRHRVTDAGRARYASLGFPSALLDSYAETAQAFAPRVAADRRARARLAALGTPTGLLRRPVVELHTRFDPLVVVQNQSAFAATVAARGRSALLQRLVSLPPDHWTGDAPYGAGHVNVTADEVVGAVDLLDGWAASGTRPAPAAWPAAMGAEVVPDLPVPAWPVR